MTEILLGPVLTDATTQKVTSKSDGKVYYRKQILPEGQFKYKGGNLDLGPSTLAKAVAAFKDSAFDEVPFNFGGPHDAADPKRRTGTMVNVEHVPGKGAFGYFDFSKSPEMISHVEKFPKFGVSPRIFLSHDRADGKKYDVAIQHVLGTDTPVMSGMEGWQSVSLSDELASATIYDFSTETVQGTPIATSSVPTVVTPPTGGDNGGDEVVLTKAQVDFLAKMMADDVEMQKLMNAGTETPAVVELPADVKLSLETVGTHAAEIAALKTANAKSAWAAKRAALLSAGVPPAQLDLATPVMERVDSTVIDLSTGEGTVKVTDKDQMLGMLEAMKGTIDLGEEMGHQSGGQTPSGESDTQEELDKWMSEHGLR